MKRLAAVLSASLLAAAIPARAEEAGRYVLKDVQDGFIRLDSKTGAISHCRPKNAQWMCESLADDRQVLQREIATLEEENAALKKRVAELEAAPKRALELPSDAEFDRFMGFFERIMQRLMEFARESLRSGESTLGEGDGGGRADM